MRGQRQHWIVAARCVCTTPLGLAVEPEEKNTRPRSEGATSAAIASTRAAGALRSPWTNSCQLSMAPPRPSISPMHTARRREGRRGACTSPCAVASSGQNSPIPAAKSRFSTERSKISSETSATRSRYSSSAPLAKELSSTAAPPARLMPNIALTHSGRFVAGTPTRVSLLTPRARSARDREGLVPELRLREAHHGPRRRMENHRLVAGVFFADLAQVAAEARAVALFRSTCLVPGSITVSAARDRHRRSRAWAASRHSRHGPASR